MGLLDGRGGLWLLHNCAMSFLLKACLDRVAEETGREPGGEAMLLIVGLSGSLPPDQAEVLERLSVRVACAAAGDQAASEQKTKPRMISALFFISPPPFGVVYKSFFCLS